MAQLEDNTALVPTKTEMARELLGTYTLTITEFDAAGKPVPLSVPLPNDEKWGNVMLRAALLKRGGSWKTFDIPTIIYAVVYADNLGLDIMAGDVYMAAEGRLATTAGAKIKHAMGTGKLKGISVVTAPGDTIKIPWSTKSASGTWEGPNYVTTVEIKVDGWADPFTYTTTLSEWFTGQNPNWRTRPVYMLEKNAMSKACEIVAPMGVEPDEAPPLDTAISVANRIGG